jgi:ADP-ribose diphosphatase
MMNKKPQILKRTLLSQSKLFGIEQISLQFSNGESRQYERIISPGAGAVMIVPVIDAEHVIMIREYAVGTDRYELLFPKGKIDPGEDIYTAASRECMEEIGYRPKQLSQIGSMTIAPGYLGFTTHTLLAEELVEESTEGDEPEPLQQVICNIHDIDRLMQHDNLSEARSIAALYQVRDILMQRKTKPAT